MDGHTQLLAPLKSRLCPNSDSVTGANDSGQHLHYYMQRGVAERPLFSTPSSHGSAKITLLKDYVKINAFVGQWLCLPLRLALGR